MTTAVTVAASAPAADLPQTVAESSEYEATCTSQQCDTFLTTCADHAPHVSKFNFGITADGRDLSAVMLAEPTAEIGARTDRLRILVIGNIHSGECAGKEAILMLIRGLAEQPDHEWLSRAVLVFVPNYNADANDRMALDNRPGQLGPIRGMGRRENSQGLDLNRDFMKIESPEASALIRLMNEFDPHVFIDCHTTNGSRHRYDLTYDVPHNPATSAAIRDYLRQQMMPRVTEVLEQQGTPTFYYGNFNPQHTTWTTYGHEPRYSTEYAGLRGRLGILSEAYSYIPYRERIIASKNFVTACIDDAVRHADAVRGATTAADRQLTDRDAADSPIEVALSAMLAAFPEPVVVRGYRGDEPQDYECTFYGAFQPTKTTTLPEAYLVPSSLTEVITLLKRHGVELTELLADEEMQVESFTVMAIERAERAFQGHRMLRISTDRHTTQRVIPAGTMNVSTRQPLGRLVACLLEPESDDGIVTWNVIDDALQVGTPYPILRIP